MNKEKIEEIREYVMERLTLIARGSYPKEQRFMENVLALTTEVSQSSSSANRTAGVIVSECEGFSSQSKSNAKSEDTE